MKNDELGRMAQHFENLNREETRIPKLAIALIALATVAAIAHAVIF